MRSGKELVRNCQGLAWELDKHSWNTFAKSSLGVARGMLGDSMGTARELQRTCERVAKGWFIAQLRKLLRHSWEIKNRLFQICKCQFAGSYINSET